MNALAQEAEAEDHAGLARALRRIALLSEVWECLKSERDQGEAAADVADFCLKGDDAPRPRPAGRYAAAATRKSCEGILRESDERWCDYLSLVDPTHAGPSVADEPDSFEHRASTGR